MEKPRELIDAEVQQSPILQDLLEQARSCGQTVFAYNGVLFALAPIEDITHTFSIEELKEFALDYAAADDPTTHLSAEQALARYRQRVQHHD